MTNLATAKFGCQVRDLGSTWQLGNLAYTALPRTKQGGPRCAWQLPSSAAKFTVSRRHRERILTDEPGAIWCESCGRPAPLNEWRRKLRRIRVADGTRIVGYVSTYEHQACGVFTAVREQQRDGSGATPN